MLLVACSTEEMKLNVRSEFEESNYTYLVLVFRCKNVGMDTIVSKNGFRTRCIRIT